jgi:hypothetical protein
MVSEPNTNRQIMTRVAYRGAYFSCHKRGDWHRLTPVFSSSIFAPAPDVSSIVTENCCGTILPEFGPGRQLANKKYGAVGLVEQFLD